MSSVTLSDLAQQKLQHIHNLVVQFQALESDLRDTFIAIETKHQNELQRLKTNMGLHSASVEVNQMNENQFFGASQMAPNPLSQGQQRGPSTSLYQTQTSHDLYPQTNSPYHNQPFRASQSMAPPIQQPPNRGSIGAFSGPQPPAPPNPANQQMPQNRAYHQQQNASQPHYTQQHQQQYSQNNRGYHPQKSQSNGVGIGQRQHPPPPNGQRPRDGQWKKPLPQNPPNSTNSTDHSPTESPSDDLYAAPGAQKKGKFQKLMGKFQQNDDAKETPSTLNGLDSGISERDFYKKYWIEAGKIGEGAFARVRKITRKSDKAVFALKMIKKKGKSSEDIAALQREILVLQKCDHDNIVRLGDWCDTKKRIYMVVEFCDGGDVFERVVQYKKFSEKSAIHVIKAVCSGLDHIHRMGFVHRDLKPDNLMYLTKEEDSAIKIIDFGLAGDVNESPCKTPCGTAHYAAPEVLSSLEYDQSADMWSLGVIIYTLLCGFPPFFDQSNNMKNLYHLIKKGQYSFPSPFWDEISDSAKDLITKLLAMDAKERLTAAEVLQHQWVANEDSAADDDLGGQYVRQMSHWQSTRQATEFGLGQEAPPPPPPDQPISLFYPGDQMNE